MPKATAAAPVLSARALNRATLARQMLLERSDRDALAAVERLAGLQAQLPRPPYVGLWSRLAGFEREHLTRLALDRRVARGTLMRATLHLVSAADYGWMRATVQPCLDAARRSIAGTALDAIDLERIVRDARRVVEERPRSFDEIRKALTALHPDVNRWAMGYAVRCRLPLVQLPADGQGWGWHGQAPFGSSTSWLGPTADAPADAPRLARRYLAAFGPASASDFGAWSGLRGARELFEGLRADTVVFRDERGRELFDLPDAPRPPAEQPAPVRFLPEYDNVLLAHDDRSRIVAERFRARLIAKNLIVPPAFLVDGTVAGTWKLAVKRGTATLALTPFAKLGRDARRELTEEGERLARFVEPEARDHVVEVAAPA
ncbi:MAG: winged helix DNA-binding domain-containing protein [Gemmatimonadaceae bacterium]